MTGTPPADTAARDLGFTAAQAAALQGFASAAITTAVPEPETWALMAIGTGFVGWMSRRRRRVAAA